MRKTLMYRVLLFVVAALVGSSCKDNNNVTPPSGVVASFQFAQDATDFHKVTFTNFSLHFASLSWDFGDASAASSEENPVHSYAAAGKYTVTLTATGSDKVTSVKSLDVTIADPNLELKKLTGETTKSWKLVRQVANNNYPLEVGPSAGGSAYFQLGNQAEIGTRPCALDDEFIFGLDGSFTYNSHGNFFADIGGDGPWNSSIGAAGCYDSNVPANWVNINNEDISKWGDGAHTFTYNSSTKKLVVAGTGAWIGLPKVGTTANVLVPQESVSYDVARLVDATVDTLVLKVSQTNGNYWKFVLVHYDNAADEPAMPGAKPTTDFSFVAAGDQVTFTNASSGPGTISYAWDFDDGATSTETSPVHTYAADGTYNVKLTATNSSGSTNVTKVVSLGAPPCTPDDAESLDSSVGINMTLETEGAHSVFGGFAGVIGGRIDNPYLSGINLSCHVNQYHKVTDGCLDYAGAAVGTASVIDFATDKKKFTLKVYAVSKLTDVVLRIERLPFPDTDPAYERTATITTVGEWQELTFDYSDVPGTPTFQNIVIYFERGQCSDELFYYFDDLKQVD